MGKDLKILIERIDDNGVETIGNLFVLNNNGFIVYECNTLELSFKGNRSNISCIPKGDYIVKKRTSKKYGEHFHILNVPQRDYILIHQANYFHQLRGCIAVGRDLAYIDSDEEIDVTKSKQTMKELLEVLPNSFHLSIVS